MGRLIRFIIAGDIEYTESRPDTYFELNERDCSDLLQWLWLEPDDFGYLSAPDLAARCRRRTWPIPRNVDPAVLPKNPVPGRGGAVREAVAGRPAGYLRSCVCALLLLAEKAGPEGQILFS